MDFLQLAQRVYKKVGLQGSISSVVGQSGIKNTVCQAVSQAWVEIQSESTDFLFRQGVTSFNTVVGKSDYTAAEVMVNSPNGVSDLSLYTRFYRSGTVLPKYPLEYKLVVNPNASGEPQGVIVNDADNSIILIPEPNRQYQIDILYLKNAQVLAVDSDVPFIPEEFHFVIFWKAVDAIASDGVLGNVGLAYEAAEAYSRELTRLKQAYIPEKTINTSGLFI